MCLPPHATPQVAVSEQRNLRTKSNLDRALSSLEDVKGRLLEAQQRANEAEWRLSGAPRRATEAATSSQHTQQRRTNHRAPANSNVQRAQQASYGCMARHPGPASAHLY